MAMTRKAQVDEHGKVRVYDTADDLQHSVPSCTGFGSVDHFSNGEELTFVGFVAVDWTNESAPVGRRNSGTYAAIAFKDDDRTISVRSFEKRIVDYASGSGVILPFPSEAISSVSKLEKGKVYRVELKDTVNSFGGVTTKVFLYKKA